MRLAVLALMVAAACGPAATRAPAATAASSPTHHPPTATPGPINVDDMMGGSFLPATVFALSGSEIHAVKLQNHHVAYRIPVAGRPHVVVSPDGARLYVADRKDGRTRVREIDTATGVEMAAAMLAEELADDGAVAQDRPDRILLLLKAGSGVRVDAISTSPLATVGGIYKSPCGDRLLASAGRIAIVCSSSGRISVGVPGPSGIEGPQGGGLIDVPGAPIVASAMLADGTLVVGTAAGVLYRVMTGAKTFLAGPELPAGSIVPDGIAPADAQRFVVFTRSGDAGIASAYDARSGLLTGGALSVPVRAPRVVALWPFAYFVGERGLWHVDLRSGLTERMLTLDDPIPLTVSSR